MEKDLKGKTQVHDISCTYLGRIGNYPCSCSFRLASGTVQSIIGQLKSLFENLGRGHVWHEDSKSGNPASSLEVQKYLKAVRLEQSKAHVSKKQAKPLFFEKLQLLSRYFDSKLKTPDLSMSERFLL